MRTHDQIVSLYRERLRASGPAQQRMIEVRDAVNGDMILALPELDRSEKPAVANLISQGLNQTAMRVASTMPGVWYPPLKPGQEKSEKYADIRRKANLGWWDASKMHLKLRRRARHMIGYGITPVLVRPNFEKGMPEWHVRDPLTTYAAPTDDPDEMNPPDVIFTYTQSWAFLRSRYPMETVGLRRDKDTPQDARFTLLEYHDHEQFALIVLGKADNGDTFHTEGSLDAVKLEGHANRAGRCLAVVPRRITLDRLQGMYDGAIGIHQMQAKLMALSVIATQRGVMPEEWIVDRPGEQAQIISVPDPRTGQPGQIRGGDIREINVNPSFMTPATMDRLERALRLDSGTPAEFGGEASSGIRTGKRGDQVLSAAVDFTVQEAQEILAESLEEENKRAVAVAKAYFPNTKSFYVGSKGAKGRVDYDPREHFETDDNVVRYSMAGADTNGLIVGVGQRIGLGTMSKHTAMEIDPLVEDAEHERDRVTIEALDAAGLSAIQTQAAEGTIPVGDLARIKKLVVTGAMSWEDAVEKVQREAQERQATEAPPGDPATMPGLSMPGMGAEAPEAIQPQAPSISNMTQMLNSAFVTESAMSA